MSIDRTVNVHVSYVQMKVYELFTDVQYWCVMYCSGGIWPGGKPILVSGCFDAM